VSVPVSGLPPIETQRLAIAPLASEDAAALAVLTDDPVITDAIHFLASPFTLADAQALIRGGVFGVDRFLGVWTRDRTLVGVVGVGAYGAAIEVGYWFGPAFHGRGFAAEAVGAVMEALRKAYPGRLIVAECRRENEASWKLLGKLGFVPEGDGQRPGRVRLVAPPGQGIAQPGR
jgi:RimJ/RimL family protein N-acetyltransferase